MKHKPESQRHPAQQRPRHHCPICGELRALPCRLTLATLTNGHTVDVCAMCFDAAQASTAYRTSAGHLVAQRQHHERTRHAH